MKKQILFYLLILLSASELSAQQLPLFTQYRENIGILNPAALPTDYLLYEHPLSFGASYRVQWADFENSPKTQTFHGDYVLSNGNAFSLITGGHLINDQTGPTGFTGVYGRIGGMFTDDPYYGGFSAALTFGMVQYRVKGSDIRLRELNDILSGRDHTQLFPDVGLGVYYYHLISGGFLDDSHVYGGLSIPQVFGLDLQFEDENGEFSTERIRHYYAMAGLMKYFDNGGFLEPSVWVKYAESAPVNVDFNLRYMMTEGFWLGAGGSSAKSIHLELGFLMGENIGADNNLKIGYGFDYFFSDFGPSTGGTHEINVSYSIGQ
ncbi:MAG: PorP/SprF family type IX secretion system membrane protein [Bacteroidota bacterium]